MKNLFNIVSLLFVIFLISACSSDDDNYITPVSPELDGVESAVYVMPQVMLNRHYEIILTEPAA
jgi:hypothetical protein